MDNDLLQVNHVVEIRRNEGKKCEECGQNFWAQQFTEAINHYLESHRYKLIHIGSVTEKHEDDIYHFTVAVVGK